MDGFELTSDPYANDEGRLGVSMLTLAEVLVACLDVVRPRSITEVGADARDLTTLLVQWASRAEASVVTIDPAPRAELVRLAARHAELELVEAPSIEALRGIELPEAVVIDGDHNHWTVSQELEAIAALAGTGALPALFVHDVGWPHGRRDDYFDPDRVPAEHRHPTRHWGGLQPGDPGIHPEGMSYEWPAVSEGGPRNGVLTAVEDFVADRADLRLAVVPAFFGLGVVWSSDAPWGTALSRLLGPWDRNPLIERLEANRVSHLADARHLIVRRHFEARREDRVDAILRALMDSRTFGLARLLSRLSHRGRAGLSREAIRRALDG